MRILFILAFSFLSAIVYGIWKYIIKTQEKAEKERWQSLYEHDLRDSCYLQVYSKYSRREKIYNKQTKKIARVTFERFLNLYAVSPEKWIITTSSYEDAYHFPIYINDIKTIKKGKENIEEIAIPLYWENPEELKKYHTWIEEQYKKGEGAYFENERNQSLKQLVDYINDDLKAKRAQTEKELTAIENQLKEQFKENKETIPQLTLDPSVKQYISRVQNWQDAAQNKMTFPPPVYQNTNAPISESDLKNHYNLKQCHYYGMVDDLPVGRNEIGDIYYLANLGASCIYTKDGWKIINDEEIKNLF